MDRAMLSEADQLMLLHWQLLDLLRQLLWELVGPPYSEFEEEVE